MPDTGNGTGWKSARLSITFAVNHALRYRSQPGLTTLRVPPSNRLEALKGDRAGQHSIQVNDQFHVCFRWTQGGAEDVEIVVGKRAITADTDLRLCRFFGLSKGYWLRAQAMYDTEVAERSLGAKLAKIKPWAGREVDEGHVRTRA